MILGGFVDCEFGYWIKMVKLGELLVMLMVIFFCVVGNLDELCDWLMVM